MKRHFYLINEIYYHGNCVCSFTCIELKPERTDIGNVQDFIGILNGSFSVIFHNLAQIEFLFLEP